MWNHRDLNFSKHTRSSAVDVRIVLVFNDSVLVMPLTPIHSFISRECNQHTDFAIFGIAGLYPMSVENLLLGTVTALHKDHQVLLMEESYNLENVKTQGPENHTKIFDFFNECLQE